MAGDGELRRTRGSGPLRSPEHLVLVAGHAAFKAAVSEVPVDATSDRWWVLQPFQAGEPVNYLAHMRRGVELARDNPAVLLLFSGGRTRAEAGPWSEARTYEAIARAAGFWIPTEDEGAREALEHRIAVEDFARDSFENLLFGLCRFHQIVGRYPRQVTVVGWAFKAVRFDLHREALRLPVACFRYVGVDDPVDRAAALQGEQATLEAFRRSPFGADGELAAKRQTRNPFGQEHQYDTCPNLREFFDHIRGPASGTPYPGRLPWEDSLA